MKLRIFMLIGLLAILLGTTLTMPQAHAVLTVSYSTSTFGFQNGAYLGFSSTILPINFVTGADGGATHQEPSTNATYPDFMFFEQQSVAGVYGFWVSGCSITINAYFETTNLTFTTTHSGTVKFQVGSLGQPNQVLSTFGSSGTYDNVLGIETLTVLGGAGDTVILSWATVVLPPAGGVGGSTSKPSPTPTPTLPPLGTNDFQIQNLDLGAVQTNSTVSATLNFRYSGSSYTLIQLGLSEPFESWLVQSSFKHYMYYLSSGSGSGQLQLQFQIPNATAQQYQGQISVSAVDGFGNTHTSSATISATVTGPKGPFDFAAWVRSHLLIVLMIVIALIVALAIVAFYSRRR